jgi:hypothetical protein
MEKIFSGGWTMNKRRICILITVLVLSPENIFAHESLSVTKRFGNVHTCITTGFQCEEINKVAIFGQLVEQLSKKLNYSGQIFLDFYHKSTGSEFSDFFISCDSMRFWNANSKRWLNLIIRLFEQEFQAQTTLKLLEYAILNRNVQIPFHSDPSIRPILTP